MEIIGIVGGIASGKSHVAKILQQLGAKVIDADRIGHQVLLTDEVKNAARARWGESIFDEAGQIDRPALAKIVFADSPQAEEELSYLENITHPEIKLRIQQVIEESKKQPNLLAVVLDAPILLKTNWRNFCDLILFVETSSQIRAERASGRGWTKAQFEARQKQQVSLEEKQKAATAMIDNSGSLAETRHQVELFWQKQIE